MGCSILTGTLCEKPHTIILIECGAKDLPTGPPIMLAAEMDKWRLEDNCYRIED